MRAFAILVGTSLGCASAPVAPSDLPPLTGTDGATYAYAGLLAGPAPTVLVFFSQHCPVQRHHDADLIAAARTHASQGVRFLMVDSEYGGDLARDRAEVASRGYPFPILLDPGGRWAEALGARFSTYAVIVAAGRVRYRGGIDQEVAQPLSDNRHYLIDALDAVLAGREPDPAATHALGCALKRW